MKAFGSRFQWVMATLNLCIGLALASPAFAEPRIEVTGGAPAFRDAALKFAPLQTAPVSIQSFLPSSAQLSASVGDTLRFSVTATPPAGATLTYRWRVDSKLDSAATTSRFIFVVRAAASVSVSVSDGRTTAEQAWTVSVAAARLASDFSGDGRVDFDDFFLFAVAFGTKRGDAGFDAKYDLNGDGIVGFDDFFIFAGDFGKTK